MHTHTHVFSSTKALTHWYSNHFSSDCSALGCTCSIVLSPHSYLGGRWVTTLWPRRGLWFVLICSWSLGEERVRANVYLPHPHAPPSHNHCSYTETGTIQSIQLSPKACPISPRPDTEINHFTISTIDGTKPCMALSKEMHVERHMYESKPP